MIIAATAAAAFVAGSARAEDDMLLYKGADRQARLIEGAKREGEVVFYCSMIVNQTQRPLAEAFMRKYPFIKMSYWRGESADIFAKLSAESRAGAVMADLVEGTGVGETAVEAGFARSFHTPEIAGVAEEYRDPNGVWAATRRSFFSVGYNTRQIAPEKAPKAYDDLLDPALKGRIVWHTGSTSGADLFVTNLRLAWGEERAEAWLTRLAEQKPATIAGASARALVDRVIAGEYSVALNIFAHHALISRAKGASVLPALMDPVASTVGTMIAPKGLRHPNAAMLLADFVLSAEGQAILAKADYFPTRGDTPPAPALAPILDAVKVAGERFVSPDALVKYTPSSAAIIRRIFGQ
jgi:ABC-type Fe3+ transport system substrate-binding protein